MRDLIVLGGSSHPDLTAAVCERLGIPPSRVHLSKFSNLETNVAIVESVRGQDVYIIQSACGNVNDMLMELLIMVYACRMASARKITVVLPLFPYSRQPEAPFKRNGMPLARLSPDACAKLAALTGAPLMSLVTDSASVGCGSGGAPVSACPGACVAAAASADASRRVSSSSYSSSRAGSPPAHDDSTHGTGACADHNGLPSCSTSHAADIAALSSSMSAPPSPCANLIHLQGIHGAVIGGSGHNHLQAPAANTAATLSFVSTSTRSAAVIAATAGTAADAAAAAPAATSAQKPYKMWTAKPGTLVAEMLMGSGANHVITLDLHHPQYQGYFTVPVDNLLAHPLVCKYVVTRIPNWQQAVIVSPDAGGAKRASAIADTLKMSLALIHKERRQTSSSSITLVGDVAGRDCIIIDDLADTCNTVARAAAVLKRYKAAKVVAIVTHGIFSANALERIMKSPLDYIVVSNSVPQEEHVLRCPKIKVFDVAPLLAEAIRRTHNGESVSFLFDIVPIVN